MDSTAERRYVIDYSDFLHKISIGAFNYKNHPNIWWRLWSILNIVSAVSILTANVSYLITEDFILKDAIYILISTQAIAVTLATQKIWLEFSENWNNLKANLYDDFADGRNNERTENVEPSQTRKFIKLFHTYYSLIPGILIFGGLLRPYSQQDADFRDMTNYLYPFYGIRRVNTPETFLLIYLWQSITYTVPFFSMSSAWLHIIIIVIEISNKTTALEERLKSISQEVHRDIALIRDYEMKNDTKKSPALIKLVRKKSQNDKKICFKKFEENLKICIQYHQSILRVIKLIKPLLNSYFTIHLTFLVLAMIGAGFWITLEKELEFKFLLVRFLILLLFSYLQVGFQCLMAQRYQDMNDRIAEQVYSLPWYELPPTYRKNVYIFLCQAQAPIKFYAFNTFRFSTFLFPSIANFVYTNTVNLLTIQNKYRRN